MLKRSIWEVILNVLEIVTTQDFQTFGLVLLADGLVLPLELVVIAEGGKVEPGDGGEDGGELVEADGVGEQDVHPIDVLISQIEHPLHPLCQLLHNCPAGAVRIPLGSDEDGATKPGRRFSALADHLLSDLVQGALLLHDEKSATLSLCPPHCPEAPHMGDHVGLADQLGLINVESNPSQQQAATRADNAQILSIQACIECQEFNVVVDEAVVAVVVYEFVVEVALGDELLFLHQRPHHLSNLQQPGQRPNRIQTHHHPALPAVLISKGGEVEAL